MQIPILLAAGEWFDMAAIVVVVVVGVIRFLAGIIKKPNVPPGAPQQAAPKTPEALQQEIERFIRQAQGREPKPAPLPPEKRIVVEQRPPEPVRQRPPEPMRQRLPAEERRETKPREQVRPKKPSRAERAPELAATPLSKRHAIEAEVQQNLGEGRAQRRSEQPIVPSIEAHMHSVFDHKVGSLDSGVDTQSMTSTASASTKPKSHLLVSKEQIRNAVIFSEILKRPNFDDE